METTAWVCAVLLGITALCQLALAFGAPAGSAAWGGRHPGLLPMRFRLSSGFAGVLLYPVVMLFVLDAGGVLSIGLVDDETTRTILWVLTGLYALRSVANVVSRRSSGSGARWRLASSLLRHSGRRYVTDQLVAPLCHDR